MLNIKRNKLILLSFFMVATTALSAQNLVPHENDKGKWGYINDEGSVVIKHDYTKVEHFIEGIAKVQKGTKWGYINESGEEVIKIQYTEMLPWNGDYCKVAVGGKINNGILTNAKWGYINRKGESILKSKYQEIGPFKNGIAYVIKGDKYGYINENFKLIIPCMYTAIGAFNEFGYCWVNFGGTFSNEEIIGGYYVVYNINGEVVVPVKYKMVGTFSIIPMDAKPLIVQAYNKGDDIKNISQIEATLLNAAKNFDLKSYKFIEPRKFSQLDMSMCKYIVASKNYKKLTTTTPRDYAISRLNFTDKVGVFDINGKELVPVGKYPIVYCPTDGLAPIAKIKKQKLEINYHNIQNGTLMFNKWIETNSITPFEDCTAIISDGPSQYLIDTNGNRTSSYYSLILPLDEGQRIVCKNNKYGIVDNTGRETIPCEYNAIMPLSEGLMCVQKDVNGLVGYMDQNGVYKIQPTLLSGQSFKNGRAVVRTKNGAGVIDTNAKTIIKTQWVDVLSFSEPNPELVWVKNTNGMWQCIYLENEATAFTASFPGVSNFNSDGYAFVNDSNNKIGVISKKGDLVIPIFLDTPEKAAECYKDFIESGKTKMSEGAVYRFNIKHEPSRNEYKLTDIILESLWDY